MNQIAVYFDNKSRQFYLHGYSMTDKGLPIAVPPFYIESEVETACVRVLELINVPSRVVPHPNVFNLMSPLFDEIGCKKWEQFYRRVVLVAVEMGDDGKSLSVISTRKDGDGFDEPEEPSAWTVEMGDSEALCSAIGAAIDACE